MNFAAATFTLDGNTAKGGLSLSVAGSRPLLDGTLAFDDSGQPLSGTLSEYAAPRAEWLPHFELDRTVTPSPNNPLGVKGAGETGTIASTPAVVNAVMDALAPLGITHIDMPLTPERVWRAMQQASA